MRLRWNPATTTLPSSREVSLTVRIPEEIRDEIDFMVEGRIVKIPRNAWLQEAIYEKLKRERRRTVHPDGSYSMSGSGKGVAPTCSEAKTLTSKPK